MDKEATDNSPRFDRRPWGTFTVLDEAEGFKVKRIEVLPGKRLSYQKHAQRAEHWVVVNGTAKVTLDDRELRSRPAKRSIYLWRGAPGGDPATKRSFLSRCSAEIIWAKTTSCVCRTTLD